MKGMTKPKVHSPACRALRTQSACDCEVSLVTSVIKVRCVCGNRWEELGIRDYRLSDCNCAFPGDEEEPADDSVDWRSHTHHYNVDDL